MTGSPRAARILTRAFGMSLLVLAAGAALSPGGDAGGAAQARGTASGDSLTQIYEVDGVKVIHRRVPTTDVVAVNLYLLGGARQVSERTAGIEPLLLSAAAGGTRNYPGAASLKAEIRTGSGIVISAEPDWTIFEFRGLAEEFDSTWAVFADRLMYPTLDSGAVALARSQLLRSARAFEDDPELMVRSLAASAAFAGHPYIHDVSGTEASLTAITIEDLRTYLNEQIVSSRLLLVIVGNVSREQVEAAVRRTIGQLPRGDYVWRLPPTWSCDSISVQAKRSASPTKYILGYFAGPLASSEDYADFRVAVAALSGIVNSRMRSEGLSYTAGAWVLDRAASGGAIYLSTTDPGKAVRIINNAINRLGSDYYSASSLEQFAKGQITSYYLMNETSEDQADFLARSYLYRGELRTPADFVNELRGVEPQDLRGAAVRYFKNIQYAFLGDPAAVPPALRTGAVAAPEAISRQHVTRWQEIRLYPRGEPECPYLKMHPIEVRDLTRWTQLQEAVFDAGGDGAIEIDAVQQDMYGPITRVTGIVIRFTDPECMW
jgi:zinc protease